MSLREHAPSLTMLPRPRPALNLGDVAVGSEEVFKGRPIPALELPPWAELHGRSGTTRCQRSLDGWWVVPLSLRTKVFLFAKSDANRIPHLMEEEVKTAQGLGPSKCSINSC